MAANTVLDFLPGGQALKLFKGASAKLKKLLTKQAKKKARKAARVGARGVNSYIGKARSELLKAQASYKKLIREHQAKLKAFKKDPIGNTNPEMLRKMMQDNPTKEVLLERVKGRIPALEKQLKKQLGELQKINEALNKK